MQVLDGRQYAPATVRNRDAILSVLRDWVADHGTILEIAAGSGEHGVYFTPRLPEIHWLSTDVEEERLHSIQAWHGAEPCARLLQPCKLDVLEKCWTVEITPPTPGITGIFCANMIHITPVSVLYALLDGAARILAPQGRLILYGPFKTQYGHSAPSNEDFDKSLRMRNPEWGIRALDHVVEQALQRGLVHKKTIAMPVNNLSLVFEAA